MTWRCATCDADLNAHVQASGEKIAPPDDGDLLLCLYCGTILVRRNQALHHATDVELQSVSEDARLELLRMAERVRRRDHTDLLQ